MDFIKPSIGVLGGSFNPVHMGHLVLAEEVRDGLGLSQVILVPARIPPHKQSEPLALPDHRLAMLKLAAMHNPRFKVSTMELEREGPSYTVDTIRQLRAVHPGVGLVFIIGADSLGELPSWKDIDRLGELCEFAVASRGVHAQEELDALKGRVPERLLSSLRKHFVEMPLIGISSSEIRRRCRSGRSIRHLVPDEVFDYIRTHRLYLDE